MTREDVVSGLMILTTFNVGVAGCVVLGNFVAPMDLRFNLAFLAGTIALCAVNVGMFYGWI